MQHGRILGERFAIEHFVSRGGMGDVYRARDRKTGRWVALKLLTRTGATHLKRFHREAEALTELSHPAIVDYVAHATEPVAFIAMEWLEGVPLDEHIKRYGALPYVEALSLGLRAAEALGAAHAAGFVHRDVTPSNLFLPGASCAQVKLLDFGIAKAEAEPSITDTGVGIGTPRYMAPEQARVERDIGPATDVFSLGSVLYYCLTGDHAYQGQSTAEILAKIAVANVPPRAPDIKPKLPRNVVNAVATLMTHSVRYRPANGSEAAAILQAALTNPGPTADDPIAANEDHERSTVASPSAPADRHGRTATTIAVGADKPDDATVPDIDQAAPGTPVLSSDHTITEVPTTETERQG